MRTTQFFILHQMRYEIRGEHVTKSPMSTIDFGAYNTTCQVRGIVMNA